MPRKLKSTEVRIPRLEASKVVNCVNCRSNLNLCRAVSPAELYTLKSVQFICPLCEDLLSDWYSEGLYDPETGEQIPIPYRQYLKSIQWKTLKSYALERARNRCQICNSDLMLAVHHRRYPPFLGEEKISDLTVLCRRCHDLFHNVKGAA